MLDVSFMSRIGGVFSGEVSEMLPPISIIDINLFFYPVIYHSELVSLYLSVTFACVSNTQILNAYYYLMSRLEDNIVASVANCHVVVELLCIALILPCWKISFGEIFCTIFLCPLLSCMNQ